MHETAIRCTGLGLVAACAFIIGWLYVRQPKSFAQVTGGLSAAVGVYKIDEQAFAAIEADVFERIREIKARTSPEGEIVDEEHRIAGVDIEVEE